MRIGIDLGGTKIEAIALDDDGHTLSRQRVDTPRGDYGRTLDTVAQLVSEIEAGTGQHGTIGVGIPGAVTPAGFIKNANSTWLIGRPLGADLETRLKRPVRLMNDANCFALSEATDGAAAGAASVFGVILGTGVGGGIVINGRCHTGANLIGGEWGHNPLPWPSLDELPGPSCYCGKTGCIESWCSGPALASDHTRVTGQSLDSRAIVAAAAAGDSAAHSTLARHHDRVARGLALVINVLDPETIVLGGGVSNIPGIVEAVTERLPAYVFSDSVVTRVVRHMHGDSSGVRGAAWLWSPRDRA
jgi:fructokinase